MSKSDLVLDYLLKAVDLKVDKITLQQICKITETTWPTRLQDIFNCSYKYIINGVLPRSKIEVKFDSTTLHSYDRAVFLHKPQKTLIITEGQKYIDGKVLKIHPCINNVTKTFYVKPCFTKDRVVFFKQSGKLFVEGKGATKSNPFTIQGSSKFYTTVHTFCVKNNKDISKKLEVVKDSLDFVGIPIVRKINNPFWNNNTTLLKISLDTAPYLVSRKYKIATSLIKNLIKKAQYYFRKDQSLMQILFKNTSFNEEQQIQLLLLIASKPKIRIKEANKRMCIILNKNNNTPLNDVVEIIKNEL